MCANDVRATIAQGLLPKGATRVYVTGRSRESLDAARAVLGIELTVDGGLSKI
jgi:hypothetical protein